MQGVGRRLLQAIRFEREAFVWMDFEDRATGDALVLVAVTRLLILLGSGSSLLALATNFSGIELLFRVMINALFFWLIYAGLVYGIARYLLNGGGSYATMLRITGFAYPTLILVVATIQFIDSPFFALALGSLWFLAVVAQGVRYTADLPLERAAVAAVGAMVGFIIVSAIFRLGF